MDALTTPSNWQRVRLGDMTTSFTKQTGFDYSASIKPTLIKEQLPNYIPFIQNKDFLGHYINYKTDYFIPNEIAIRFPQILLNEKCLLISISGAIGNVAVFNHSQNAFIGGAIAVLKFKEKKSLDFVMHFLMSASGQKLLLNGVKSSSHKNLTIADLRDLLIPLPPLNEQIAIANILSDVDHYLYSLDALILKKESVKKALSFELLSQRKRLKGFNQNWQKVRLGTYKYRRGSFPQPYGNPQWYSDNGMPFVQVYDVGENFKLTQKTKQKISKIAQPMSVFVPKNSVIITLQGTIGRVALTQYDCYCDRTILIFDNNTLNGVNKYFFVLSLFTKFEEEKRKADGSIIKTITKQTLKDFEILLPSLNEQIAIANILSDVDHEIISLKNKKRQFENIKKALNHDLMSAKIRVLKK
ncbi:restriction endonuclease subunit S [Helicobacter pylori]|uniref:restriction endonuclease subunit S n=1 Tax=Helicobacter pylori TaxID=210 RepID=UPI000FDE6EAA|nr:restriction endonuclease subunit S [Helicobacter pylori]RVZ10327.1 restriction endonuclease subunit S [Helicobacter pylori]WQW95023.1 restriction endonuclease subunit S [Helicobacter pylori]